MAAKSLVRTAKVPGPKTGSIPGAPTRPDCRETAFRIRVLIADDHLVVREGLAAIIGRQPDMEVVAQARDGREAVELWRQHRPDVALLDLRMPEMDGVGTIQKIREGAPDAHLILLSTFDSDEDIYRGMKAGAKAYLLKDAEREELLQCIRKVHRGEVCVPPAIAAKLAARLGGEELSCREREVLMLLAEGRSNKEIGTTLFIGETTVKSHLKNLFSKLKVISRTEAVSAATRRGLIRL